MKECSIVYVGLKTGVKWLDGDFNSSQSLSQSSKLAKLQKEFESKNGSQKEYKGKYKTVNVNTINTAKGNITKEKSKFNIIEFNKRIDNLLYKYMQNDNKMHNAI